MNPAVNKDHTYLSVHSGNQPELSPPQAQDNSAVVARNPAERFFRAGQTGFDAGNPGFSGAVEVYTAPGSYMAESRQPPLPDTILTAGASGISAKEPLTKECIIKYSKFLSFVLRHRPQEIGLTLDKKGWANIDELIEKSGERDQGFNHELIKAIVEYKGDKKRFALSADESRIRATHGHTVPVDVEPEKVQPPEILYHGTAARFLKSIQAQGLKSQKRIYVHLSNNPEEAIQVGRRHGKPVVLLVIPARAIADDGQDFFLSDNGVWLTGNIDKKYLGQVIHVKPRF